MTYDSVVSLLFLTQSLRQLVMGMGTALVVDTEVAQETVMGMEAMEAQVILLVFLQP